MRTVVSAVVLAVVLNAAQRRLWRWWRYYGATPMPAELVKRSNRGG